MIAERDVIAVMEQTLPSARQCGVYESDAEPVHLDAGDYLISTDEFSSEDLFRERDLHALGWNIAAGALSDLLACGATPRYYLHALTAAKHWELPQIRRLARGMADALNACDARCIGGDTGLADEWRCTATVLGHADGRAMKRTGAVPGDGLFLTGPLGAGNVEAALTMAKPRGFARLAEPRPWRIPVRLAESRLLTRYASACVDTSDGVCAALNTLADVNRCGYAVAELPYCRAGQLLSALMSLPVELLFLGGCGEYELLCTVPADRQRALLAQANAERVALYRIGELTPRGRFLQAPNRTFDLEQAPLSERGMGDPRAYVRALTEWIRAGGAT